jgi:hypothetical protein
LGFPNETFSFKKFHIIKKKKMSLNPNTRKKKDITKNFLKLKIIMKDRKSKLKTK